MTILKKGVTGLNTGRFISEEDIKSFLKSIGYPYIISYKTIHPPKGNTNYWRVGITNEKDHSGFDLLINSSHWYLSLISKDSEWGNLKFMNFTDEFQSLLKGLNNNVLLLSKNDLSRSVESKDLSALDISEQDQIKYWSCKTIGEIIFNGFD